MVVQPIPLQGEPRPSKCGCLKPLKTLQDPKKVAEDLLALDEPYARWLEDQVSPNWSGDKNLQLGLMSLFQEYQSKLKTPSLGFLYWVFHPAEEAAEMTEEGVQCRNLEVFEKNRLRWHHGGYCRPMFINKHLAAGNQDTMRNTDVMLQDHSEEQTMRMRKPHGTAVHLSATA